MASGLGLQQLVLLKQEVDGDGEFLTLRWYPVAVRSPGCTEARVSVWYPHCQVTDPTHKKVSGIVIQFCCILPLVMCRYANGLPDRADATAVRAQGVRQVQADAGVQRHVLRAVGELFGVPPTGSGPRIPPAARAAVREAGLQRDWVRVLQEAFPVWWALPLVV